MGAGRAADPGSSGQVWADPAPTPSFDSEHRSTTPRRPKRLHLVSTLTSFRLARGATCKPLHFNPAVCTLVEACIAVVVIHTALAPLSCDFSAQFPGFSLLATLHDIWSNFCKQEILLCRRP